ncbi:DUF2207 domain-containing protein [Latilactobacillus graminis]|uniref:DUF2207 domain-containing protein n=2 Tax=Latilactobacillus graminis TaxID=60519 RepID=A0AA89I118_9LACO|nr:DUF2207 domain-containing protein [Latilactobacillus graminis]KRM22271.1 hypothetical protein FC90_GL000870 [Latilactobacillus graminis DSM 20719]QFP79552.1 DUF2207 domain-containing protein [Latilactobacillus graminis]
MNLKPVKFGAVILITALCAIIFSRPVYATDTYDISRYLVNVDIQANGSAQVEQKTVFDIQDDIHGVYLNQNLQTNVGLPKKLVNPQVVVNDHPLSRSKSGVEDTYSLTNARQNYRFKLYQSAQDGDQLAVTLKYQLQNLIINYRDTAELNWKVIGDAWNSDLQNVQVVIQLPTKLKKSELKSWTHGNLDGQQVVEPAKGRVTIKLVNSPANQFVESHIIFPTAVTAENQNKIDKPRRAAVIKQEARLAQQANQKRKAQQQRYWFLSATAVILAPILFLFILRKVRKALPIVAYTGQAPEHVYDLPDENGPAIVRQLLALPMMETAGVESLSATILDLVARKNLTIAVQESRKELFHKKTPQFSLTLINRNQLTYSEQKLVSWLFDVIGDEQHVSLLEIEKYPKQHSAKLFNQHYHAWQVAVETESKRSGWLCENISELMTSLNYWLIGLGTLILIFIFGALIKLVAWWTLLPMLIVFILTVWRRFNLQLWTQLGYEKRGEWQGFKQMLKDISTLDMADVPDVLLWDRYLSYATAFGIADKVVKALKVHLTPEQLQTMPLGYYYFYGYSGGLNIGQSFTTTLNDSVTSAVNTANPTSVSGGSGGFSGGSSGGFGGGSGGGTF